MFTPKRKYSQISNIGASPLLLNDKMSSQRYENLYSGSAGALSKRPAAKIYRSLNIAAREHSFKRVGTTIVLGATAGSLQTPGILSGTGAVVLSGVPVAGYTTNTMQFGAALSFALNNVVNTTEITNLFDNYRIKEVKLKIDFSYNQAPSQGGGLGQFNAMPYINITPDYDDDQAPSNVTQVLEHSYCKSMRMYNQGFKMRIQPRAQQTVTGGVLSAGGMLPRSTWLDTNSPAIKHYGVKMWFTDIPDSVLTNNAWTLTITPIYYIEAKNVA